MTADAINLTQAGTLSPEDYAQQQALNRQQRFAEMLMGQNQQPQGQMVSGRYVPRSFFEMLQPAANMIAGAYIGKQSDTEAAKLAEKIRLGKATAEESIINKMTGTPEVPAQPAVIPQGQTLRDDNGMLTYGAQQGIAGKPAIKPDLAAALREILMPLLSFCGVLLSIKSTLFCYTMTFTHFQMCFSEMEQYYLRYSVLIPNRCVFI